MRITVSSASTASFRPVFCQPVRVSALLLRLRLDLEITVKHLAVRLLLRG
jgi:hypothetical protein